MRKELSMVMLGDVPSLATGKVVLGFVVAIIAVITESSETACTAAKVKDR